MFNVGYWSHIYTNEVISIIPNKFITVMFKNLCYLYHAIDLLIERKGGIF